MSRRSTGLWAYAQAVALVLGCLSLSGCKGRPVEHPPSAEVPASGEHDKHAAPVTPASTVTGRLWVERHISGGVQCEEQRHPPGLPGTKANPESGPPSIEEVTKDLPFHVYDARREAMAVCSACGCPAYAFAYRVLIDAGDLQAARAAGFNPSR